MTTETRGSAADAGGVEYDPRHAAALQAIEQKQQRTEYACKVLHRESPAGVTTAGVMAWLAAYGFGEDDPQGQKRNRISPVVSKYRRENDLEATGGGKGSTSATLPVLTPELLDALDEQRATGTVVPFRHADGSAKRPTGHHRTASARPAGPDTRGDASPATGHRTPDASGVASPARPDAPANEGTPGGDTPDRTPDTAGQSPADASAPVGPLPVVPAVLDIPIPPAPAVDDRTERTRPVPQGIPEGTRLVPDRTPPVRRMVRFGWQASVGPFAVLLGFAALLAGAAEFAVDRLFGRRLVEFADWRVAGAVAVAGVLLAGLGALLLRTAPRKQVTLRPLTAAARAWYVMFVLALAASADASFRVWHDVLKVSTWEAVAFFAVVEVGLLAAGLSMRAHLRQYGTPGPARALVWLLSAFGVLSALLVSGWPYGLWRAIGGPAASVLALHMALGVELRAEGAREQFSRFRQALRSLGEHLLSYVGAGTGEQTWIVIRQERAFARAARLASAPRLTWFGRWRYRRAYRASGAGRSEQATAGLMKALAAERAADALRLTSTTSLWDGTEIEAPARAYLRLRAAEKGKGGDRADDRPAR